MRKILFVMLSTLMCVSLFAYDQLDNIWCNQWNVVSHSHRPGQPLYGAGTMIYQLEGDTTINQQVYTKLVYTYTPYCPTEKWYRGALRFTENKKVYIYYDNTEYL